MEMMIDFRVFLLLAFVIYIFGFLMGYITGRYNRMKEIIDITEKDYTEIKNNKYWADRQTHELLEEAVINGTPIPDNATNGDVIKALFPNTKSRIGASSYTTCVEFEGIMKTYLVPTDWWNAPYDKETL